MSNQSSMQSFGKDVQDEMVGGIFSTPDEEPETYDDGPVGLEDTKDESVGAD